MSDIAGVLARGGPDSATRGAAADVTHRRGARPEGAADLPSTDAPRRSLVLRGPAVAESGSREPARCAP